MPKKTWNIERFHGGLNNNASRSDIGENELTSATDIMVDEPGIIRTMGTNIAHVATPAPDTPNIQAGYGLFHLSADRYDINYTTGPDNDGLCNDFRDDGQNLANWTGSGAATGIASADNDAYINNNVCTLKNNTETEVIVWVAPVDSIGGSGNDNFSISDTQDLIIAFKPASVTAFFSKLSYLKVRVGDSSTSYWWWFIRTNDFVEQEWNVVTLTKSDANGVGNVNNTGWDNMTYLAVEATTSAAGVEFQIDGISTREVSSVVAPFDNFLFFTDDNELNIYSFLKDTWNDPLGTVTFPQTIGPSPGDVKPVYTSVDGILFVTDSHSTNASNTGKKLFYAGHTRWAYNKNDTTPEVISDWFFGNIKGPKPTSLVILTAGEPTAPATDLVTAPLTDTRVYIRFQQSSGGAWSANKTYWLGAAYIFLSGDISEIKGSSASYDVVAGKKINFGVGVGTQVSKEVVGVKIFMKEGGKRIWWSILTCMFNGSCYFADEVGSQGDKWDNPYSLNTHDRALEQELEITTYEDETGINNESELDDIRYKASVISNRKMYIGNLMYKVDGVETVKGDTMCVSPVNKFSTFSSERFIDAAINDGEAIVKLEEFADRILQFKERTLYLLNVSQEIEFLEDKFPNKGVKHPAAVCKTDFGVAWVNRLGCYLYDGKQVHNILEKKGLKLIKPSIWESFTTDTSTITYVPKKRQLIVLKDCTTASKGDIYLYDMVTQSWVEGDSAFTDDKEQTNFVIDNNADVVHVHSTNTGTILKWNDTSATKDKVDFRTGVITFGSITQRKKIYKIYVTHKNAGDGDQIGLYGEFYSQKATGGEGEGQLSNDFFFGYLQHDTDTNQSGNYITQEFIAPSTDLDGNTINFNSVYSLRLYLLTSKSWGGNEPGATLAGTAPAGFAVNDISIVYRIKSMK